MHEEKVRQIAREVYEAALKILDDKTGLDKSLATYIATCCEMAVIEELRSLESW